MTIELVEIKEALTPRTIEVQVRLLQNDLTAVIHSEARRFIPDFEPVESTFARALAHASEWLKAGEVNLRNTGSHVVVART